MAGYVAALGLTVALFVATAAFEDPTLLGQGKMGALFSGFVGLTAVALGRALGMHHPRAQPPREASGDRASARTDPRPARAAGD
jgi:hypothetical protein